jgi:hypothetical protein
MRALTVGLLLLPTLALADRKPVVAVLPVQTKTPELARLGQLIDVRAEALLASAGRESVLDLKQVLAMASQEGLSPGQLSDDAERTRVILGADLVVALSLDGAPTHLLLKGAVRDAKGEATIGVELPAGWAGALTAGSEAVARAVLAHEGGTLASGVTAQPESRSELALVSLGDCWDMALRQPMGIDAPVGLSGSELEHAVAACRAALKADAGLRFAGATLALLLAIEHDDVEAQALLGAGSASDAALTPWLLARYWLLSRATSASAAVTFLDGVVKSQPTVLVARSLQASALAAMNDHARAVAAWNEYLVLAPASAFAQGRLSQSLGRQGKADLALAAATKGLALAPQSREARLVLAARQREAGKLEAAKATLQPLVALPNAPAEPMVQLGLALLAAGDLTSARPLFQTASERAMGPRAWKTKGRALYSLAVIEAKSGHLDAAKGLYAKSLETGLRVTPADPALAALSGGSTEPAPTAAAGGLYVNLPPVEAATPTAPVVETALHDKLTGLGAAFAPSTENPAAALSVIKSNRLKGYELRLKTAGADRSLGVEMLVMSYPEKALKGTWTAKAAISGSGEVTDAKQAKVIKALVTRVVDDAATDLDWK